MSATNDEIFAAVQAMDKRIKALLSDFGRMEIRLSRMEKREEEAAKTRPQVEKK